MDTDPISIEETIARLTRLNASFSEKVQELSRANATLASLVERAVLEINREMVTLQTSVSTLSDKVDLIATKVLTKH